MSRRNSKVAHFDSEEYHQGGVTSTMQRQHSLRSFSKIQQHYDSAISPRSLHKTTYRSSNGDDDVKTFHSNQLQRHSSHRSLHNHNSHHSVGDYDEGFLSARSDRSGPAYTTRSSHNHSNNFLHNLEFKNFNSNDLFDSNCVHTTYNDFESRLIRETKYCRVQIPGKSIASIHKNPRADFEFKFGFSMQPTATVVSSSILLGSRSDASDLALLKRYGVTHILNVAQQLPLYFEQNFVCLKIPIADSPLVNITDYQKICSAFLSHVENIGGRVLVHCISGVSRSVSVVVMHFIVAHKFKLRVIYGYLKSCRPTICPNDGFKYQLAMLEVSEIGCSSIAGQNDKDWNFYQLNSIRHSLPIEGKQQPRASNYTKRLLYDGSSGHADTNNRHYNNNSSSSSNNNNNSNSSSNNFRSQSTALSLPRHGSSGSGTTSKKSRSSGGGGGGDYDDDNGMVEESFCVIS